MMLRAVEKVDGRKKKKDKRGRKKKVVEAAITDAGGVASGKPAAAADKDKAKLKTDEASTSANASSSEASIANAPSSASTSTAATAAATGGTGGAAATKKSSDQPAVLNVNTGQLIGEKVANAVRDESESVLDGILKKNLSGLHAVLFKLVDDKKFTLTQWTGEGPEDWPNYKYKLSGETVAVSGESAKSYTSWRKFTDYVKERIYPDAVDEVKVHEQTLLLSSASDDLKELTEEHRELAKIESMPFPEKNVSAYDIFAGLRKGEAEEALAAKGYDAKSSFNNIPAAGYHREAGVRKDGSKVEVCYHKPGGGEKLRNRNDVVRHLEEAAPEAGSSQAGAAPSVDDFDFSPPLVSMLWKYPKIDHAERVSATLKGMYDNLSESDRVSYDEAASRSAKKYIADISRYREWKRARAFVKKEQDAESQGGDPASDDLAQASSSYRFPKRKRKAVTQVAYSEKPFNMFDGAALAVRKFTQPSTLVDFEREIFMTDFTTQHALSSLMTQLRSAVSSLLRKGAVRRVFSNPDLTDGHNFFKGARATEPTSDAEVELREHEIEIKRVEATLRSIIIGTLQVDPYHIASSCGGLGPTQADYDFIADSDWLRTDHKLLNRRILLPDGAEAEIVAWYPEVDCVQEEPALNSGKAAKSNNTAAKSSSAQDGALKGKTVARKAMFKAEGLMKMSKSAKEWIVRVSCGGRSVGANSLVSEGALRATPPQPQTHVLHDFQAQSFCDAYELKQQLAQCKAQIQGHGNPLHSFKSKVGKKLRFAEIETTLTPESEKTTSAPRWMGATCVAVDPIVRKINILPDGAEESLWCTYDSSAGTFTREGDDPKTSSTEVVFDGSSAALDAGSDMLSWLAALPHGYQFADPVDPVALGIPHYRQVVSNPMDISTIQQKLYAGSYKGTNGEVDLIGKFWSDIALMFDNAVLFNGEKSELGVAATKLKKKCEKRLLADIKKLKGRKSSRGSSNNRGGTYRGNAMEIDEHGNNIGIGSMYRSKSYAVEAGVKISTLIPCLPILSDVSKFSLPSTWIARKNPDKKSNMTALNAMSQALSSARILGERGKKDLMKSLQFLKRADFTTTASDRLELELLLEKEHALMGSLYDKVSAAHSKELKKKKKKKWAYVVKGEEAAAVAKENGDNESAGEDDDELFSKNFWNSWPPYLGRISEGDNGGIVWEIRRQCIVPAIRHILRGLIQSNHIFEVESISQSKNSSGGGTICVANCYVPGVPYSVLSSGGGRGRGRKKKGEGGNYENNGNDKEEEEEEEEELTDYEKARLERVERNHKYLQSLGLA